MENRKNVTFWKISLIGALLLAAPLLVSAYGISTHALLTEEIIKLAHRSFPALALDARERASVVKGTVEEDNGIRWLQHFYDPVHHRGLTLGETKAANPNLAYAGSAPIASEWQSAKNWAMNTGSQAGVTHVFGGVLGNYFTGNDDYSWERGIYEYAWGDKARGLESLGHVLHLIEDVSVPDHTRNDPHPALGEKLKGSLSFLAKPQIIAYLGSHNITNSSPYESFAHFGPGSIAIADTLITEHKQPIILNSLSEYFDELASYSNKNFFSKDTIFNPEYLDPTIKKYISVKLLGGASEIFGVRNLNGDQYKVVRVDDSLDWKQIIKDSSDNIYFITDNDQLILKDYWSILSKQAVLHGAGVVKLFFDEVAKEKQTKELYHKNKSWMAKGYDGFKQAMFGTAGALYGISVTGKDVEEDNPPEPSALVSASVMHSVSLQTLAPPSSPRIGGYSPLPLLRYQREVGRGSPSLLPPLAPPVPGGEPEAPKQFVTSISTAAPQSGVKIISSPPSPTPPPSITKEPIGGGEPAASPSSAQHSGSQTPSPSPSSLPTPTPTPTPTATPTDTQPPALSFAVSECSASLGASGCLIASTTITIAWSSPDRDLAHYTITCATGHVVCSGFSFASTTATTTIYTAPTDSSIYVFTATATDTSGNESAPQSVSVEVSLRPLVINEIAWAGTGSSAAARKDEWMELYNPASQAVSLSNITLKSLTNPSLNISLSGTVPSHGYYLIERTDDNDITDIAADLTARFGSGLSNSGEQLAIVIGSTTLDRTPAVSACGGWCGGSASGQYPTMERYDPLSSGEDSGNWGSWQNIVSYGTNEESQPIKGTPRHRNSINYLIVNGSTNLGASKTITKTNSPYVVPTQTVIDPSATLTIEPGVVIKFKGTSAQLYANGIISAIGTAADPIIFTSFADDSYAGDTNQNGASTSPAAGDWGSILLVKSGSTIDHAVIRYGGGDNEKADIKVKNISADVKNSTIEQSKYYGISFDGASGTITSNIIRDNRAQPNSQSTGVLIVGGTATVSGNTFTGNYEGLELQLGASHTFTVTGNTFTDNTKEAIVANGAYPSFSGNAAAGNGTNGIVLTGLASDDYSLQPDLPYVIPASSGYTVPSGKKLTIMPGAIMKFKTGAMIDVVGTLDAQGTAASPIVFTSFYDDDFGLTGGCGDTDNASTTPQAGDWFAIRLESSSGPSILRYATVRYGGKSASPQNSGAIQLYGSASTTIAHATIEKNYSAGMRAEGTSPRISDSLIQDNKNSSGAQYYGLFLTSSSTPTIQNSRFKNNNVNIYLNDSTCSYTDAGGNTLE